MNILGEQFSKKWLFGLHWCLTISTNHKCIWEWCKDSQHLPPSFMDILIKWKCSCPEFLGETYCVLLLQHILPPNLYASQVFNKPNDLCLEDGLHFRGWFIFITDWFSVTNVSSNNLGLHLFASTNKCLHVAHTFLIKGTLGQLFCK